METECSVRVFDSRRARHLSASTTELRCGVEELETWGIRSPIWDNFICAPQSTPEKSLISHVLGAEYAAGEAQPPN